MPKITDIGTYLVGPLDAAQHPKLRRNIVFLGGNASYVDKPTIYQVLKDTFRIIVCAIIFLFCEKVRRI